MELRTLGTLTTTAKFRRTMDRSACRHQTRQTNTMPIPIRYAYGGWQQICTYYS